MRTKMKPRGEVRHASFIAEASMRHVLVRGVSAVARSAVFGLASVATSSSGAAVLIVTK